MNSDKNSLIGFVILGALLIGYIFYNQNAKENFEKAKQAKQDSIAMVQQRVADSINASAPVASTDSANAGLTANSDTAINDSSSKGAVATKTNSENTQRYGSFSLAATTQPQQTVIDNGVFKITFSSKGARPKKMLLHKYTSYDSSQVILEEGKYNDLNLQFITTGQKVINTSELNFDLVANKELADSSQKLVYRLYAGDTSKYLQYTYVVHPDNYMLDFDISAINMGGIISPANDALKLQWNLQGDQQEEDREVVKRYTQVYYGRNNESEDYWRLESDSEKDLDEDVQWMSFRQQFFNRTLIAKDKDFIAASYNSKMGSDDDSYVARVDMTFKIPYTPSDHFSFPMSMYSGPNDYYTLMSYGVGLESVVQLGYGIYAFAKYLNKWIFLPLFLFLANLFSEHWGLAIIFMTVVIRLLTSPLTYKSYLSQAKMKALKPEIDELKKKYEGDQQKFGMEQMSLYRQAGVSPLGGCLPMLLQLPIFASLYCLFQSLIEVRHQSFLWIDDLSRYDSIAHLPFSIPFYGDHVSLLALLMAGSSLLMSMYSMNMSSMGGAGGANQKMMKYMPYIMPIFFLGFFNRFAAALTLYYFISNLITLLIQLFIKKFVIDEEKIHAQLQAKRKQKPKKSKLMQRMEDMQKQQQQANRQRNQR